MELDLEIILNHPEDLSSTLIGEDGRLLPSVDIGQGITLQPQFTSLKTSHMTGGPEILLFLLGIPVGIASQIIADYLYDWLCEKKASKVRINKREIIISDGKKVFIERTSEIIKEK
jgi:hypothetical protein